MSASEPPRRASSPRAHWRRLGPDRAHPGRSARRCRAGDRRGAGVRPLHRPGARHHLGRGSHRLYRRLGGDDRRQPAGAHRWACAPRPGAAPAAGRGAQRWVEMFNCLVAIAFTFGMVWYGWEVVEHRAAARSAQFDRTCSSRCGSITPRCRSAAALMLVRYVIRLVRYAVLRSTRRRCRSATPSLHEAPPSELAMPTVTE